MKTAARIALLGAAGGAYQLLGEVADPDDGHVALLAVVGLLACVTLAAVVSRVRG